jgi:osmotically-inducible protein OsmY
MERAAMVDARRALMGWLLVLQLAGCSPMPTQQSAAEAIDDGVVTAKIKARLVDDPLTKAHQIKVDTFRGTVELSGFVETVQVRTRALELARNVEGVKRVRDAMDIRQSRS